MTRAEAIKNGTLVDVSRTAVEAGFCMPVALTRMVHDRCVKKDSHRLWDLLVELYEAIDEAPDDGSEEVEITFGPHNLTAKCHPGENPDPVVTIMYEDENDD